ncbi:hypothetical protein OZ668_18345 [Elizabethkingia sp. HX XZB]|uniref:LA_2272 family surface repeat-containing protein n=1 Tax=Elizabethkingia TaxID=308865 RepID=UPI002A23EA5A|nr:hypothetical protein [Elizabethkingia sp. HX XZB]MDX8569964.1 hypothetical protein [Elizabethkingia sp. HX XZB]
MKTNFIFWIVLAFSQLFQAQDSIRIENSKFKIFAFTPVKNNISKVNGMTAGLGLSNRAIFKDAENNQAIVNGLNLDLNPLGFIIFCFYDPDRDFTTKESVLLNGLNLSIAGHLRDVSQNGVNISAYNYAYQMNGVSFSLIGNSNHTFKGVSVAFMGNAANKGEGLAIASFNGFDDFKGVQIGIVNRSDNMKGLQIGLFNKNETGKNFQIGLWNKNEKRSFPIINWNLKKLKS